MFWLYVNHRKFVEAGLGNMSYVYPNKIGEGLCLIVVDEAYCIQLASKPNNFILFHFVVVVVVVVYSLKRSASIQQLGKTFAD